MADESKSESQNEATIADPRFKLAEQTARADRAEAQAAASASASANSSCQSCGRSHVPLPAAFFVRRNCTECGRSVFVRDVDPKTGGMRVLAGDAVTVNVAALAQTFKLRGGAQFTRAGLDMFARTRIMPSADVARAPHQHLVPLLNDWSGEAEGIIRGSALLRELGLDAELDADRVVTEVLARKESREYWALIVHIFCEGTREHLARGDAFSAAGFAASASAARAMLTFKSDFEEVVWRGHSLETLRAAVRLWTANRKNDDEEFWQTALASRSFVLSQVFATPVVVVRGKAYVGGKGIDNSGGNIADFLLKNEVTSGAALVELKVPTAPLLAKTPYRNNIFAPSAELTAAVAQVTSYAASLAENAAALGARPDVEPVKADCIVVVGDAEASLLDEDRRRSFELYRAELRTVRVITFDELFRRVDTLARLFGA